MTESDEAFLKRMAHSITGISLIDWNRLSTLAERGAKVPDEQAERERLDRLASDRATRNSRRGYSNY